jgi:hypothetical protein
MPRPQTNKVETHSARTTREQLPERFENRIRKMIFKLPGEEFLHLKNQ